MNILIINVIFPHHDTGMFMQPYVDQHGDPLHTQKKQVFKNKRKNASYVSILFLKPTFLCFSNTRCSVFDYFQCFLHTLKTPDLDNFWYKT